MSCLLYIFIGHNYRAYKDRWVGTNQNYGRRIQGAWIFRLCCMERDISYTYIKVENLSFPSIRTFTVTYIDIGMAIYRYLGMIM